MNARVLQMDNIKERAKHFKHPLGYNMGHRFMLRVIIYIACIS
jgi:hypothetical protein